MLYSYLEEVNVNHQRYHQVIVIVCPFYLILIKSNNDLEVFKMLDEIGHEQEAH